MEEFEVYTQSLNFAVISVLSVFRRTPVQNFSNACTGQTAAEMQVSWLLYFMQFVHRLHTQLLEDSDRQGWRWEDNVRVNPKKGRRWPLYAENADAFITA